MKRFRFLLNIIFVYGLVYLSQINVYAAAWTNNNKVSCGNITKIPAKLPELCSSVINIVQVIIPVLLVIWGVIDLSKSVVAGKDDDVKMGQKTLLKRIVMGLLVFFIVALVKLLVGIVGDNFSQSIVSCIDCFVNNSCSG